MVKYSSRLIIPSRPAGGRGVVSARGGRPRTDVCISERIQKNNEKNNVPIVSSSGTRRENPHSSVTSFANNRPHNMHRIIDLSLVS